ncbi:MupA/Atu3671 family FMN-dependent luciferase-like monooxygenase [Roseovarius aquimarinus]|uniref:MupA/Atu3671 family FMN-dependent luciferase-like monooxygenase n=1 Tax=Roseovarius aquimarinus TaxID=1229156 RepID=A0ABW7I3V0_9RHOB
MSLFTCALIGDESLTIACGARLIERGARILGVATRSGAVRDWAEGAGLPVTERIEDLPPRAPEGIDWLISAANLRIVSPEMLRWPKRGAVNFHDGPLPELAGVNAPVWAIAEGRSSHGISWHMMEAGVDTGDILAKRRFPLPQDMSAHALNARCYAEGLEAFEDVMTELASPAPRTATQAHGARAVHRRADLVPRAGYLDFAGPARAARDLVRALDFAGHANPVACARIVVGGTPLAVGRAEEAEGQGAPGRVLVAGGDWIEVMCADRALRLTGLRRMDGRAPDLAVVPGEMLASVQPDMIALGRLAQHEDHWRAALGADAPIAAPLARAAGEAPRWELRDLAVPEGLARGEATARIARWAALSAGGEGYLAYAAPAIAAAHEAAPRDIAPWMPLASGRAPEALVDAEAHGAMAADLGLRLAGAPGLSVPDVGLSETGAPIGGCALCVLWPEGRLAVDAARIDADAASLLAARLEECLAAPPEGLPEADRLRLDAWQGPEVSLGEAETIHAAIAAEAARHPEADALVFEDRALSYGDLMTQVEAVAAMLQEAGSGRGAHVALCAARGPELVIGALGILRAGAAYVPLDPDYPAARLAHAIEDSDAAILLSQAALASKLPESGARVLYIEDASADHAPVIDGATPDDPAYLIYTSGSTGTPKGVSVSHRNVANFRAGMDAHIGAGEGRTWLAVTSLAFDISVLELFHTLARGFRVVIAGGETRAAVSSGMGRTGAGRGADKMEFGLYYWGNDGGSDAGKYHLLLEGAKFADAHGFASVWTPERHFHAFGGAYPNPSVTGAAVAAVTRNVAVRAGSCVAPLHHPARIAEEWAVIDNLTGGRAGLALASGWQPDDFILRPENTPPENKPALMRTLQDLRALWRGEEVAFETAGGGRHAVTTYPRPLQAELPVWVTTAGNPETWREAGRLGAHVLTHLLGQSIEEVRGKIALYHEALREAGHDPAAFDVTMMLHTYLADTREAARETARGPMKDYLRSAAGLIKQYAWAFPAFKKPKGIETPMEIDLAGLEEDEMEAILEFAYQRYFEDAGLFGTVEDALARTEELAAIGVTEIACLVDYGIEAQTVLDGLRPLAELLRRTRRDAEPAADDFSIAAQISRHDVTHLQCTPSMGRILAMDPEARAALGRLEHIYLGGEALPADLVADLRRASPARIFNMYGPTETTIWSTVQPLDAPFTGTAPIGRPIANTVCHVLGPDGARLPIGVPGQLWIGGAGVAGGYWRRDALTAERFRDLPGLAGGRLYDTGDLAAWRADGTLGFIGRSDGQIKIRGHRIELGEIEARLAALPGVTGAVVTASGTGGDIRLTGHVTGMEAQDAETMRAALARDLPPAMVPARIMRHAAFPLTPNKKIDRKALAGMQAPAPAIAVEAPRPAVSEPKPTGAALVDLEARIAAIWCTVLGLPEVKPGDNFFQLGGHSLLAVQMHRDIRAALPELRLSITDVFRFPVLSELAAHLGGGPTAGAMAPSLDARAEIMERRRAMRAARGQAAQ